MLNCSSSCTDIQVTCGNHAVLERFTGTRRPTFVSYERTARSERGFRRSTVYGPLQASSVDRLPVLSHGHGYLNALGSVSGSAD